MAHYDKQSGQIILSVEDQEILKEQSINVMKGKTPIADSIIKNILKGTEISPLILVDKK